MRLSESLWIRILDALISNQTVRVLCLGYSQDGDFKTLIRGRDGSAC